MFKKIFITPLLNYSINSKLRLTYIAFILIVLVGGVLVIYQGYEQKAIVTKVTKESAVIINQLRAIREGVTELSAMSGLYLLTREESYKEKYHETLKRINQDLSSFSDFQQSYAEMYQSLEKVKTKLTQLDSSFLNVMSVGINDSLNKPALAIAAESIGPLFNQILQITSVMIDSEDEADEISEKRQKVLKTVYEIRTQWLSLSRNITVYLTYRNPTFANEFTAQMERLKGQLDTLSELEDDLTFEQVNGLEELQGIYGSYKQAVEKMVQLHSGDDWRKDSHLIRSDLGPLLKSIQKDIDDIVSKEQKQADIQVNNMLNDIDNFAQNTIIMVSLSIVICIIIIIAINLLVLERLRSTKSAMHEISSGGGLGHTLDESGKDELSELAVDFNSFIGKIKGVVDLVIISSSNLANEAYKMSSVTECAMDLSSSQQKKTSEISTINTEISEQMVTVAKNASEAAHSIEESKSVAENGRNIVQKAIESVQKIASEVENSSHVVKELEEDTHSIGAVIGVIQSISEQTNLLALNAAIEAARAGEAGRGFAVVADEVRSLSHKIQEETITIKEKIEKLQAASTGVVQKMDSMRENTVTTVDLSSQAGSAFDNIVRDISVITSMNQQNAEATENQRQNNEKVSTALMQLGIMAQTMANTSQDAYNSGNEFKIMAQQLKDIVQQFIDEADDRAFLPVNNASSSRQETSSASNLPQKSTNGKTEVEDDVELF